MNILKVPLSTGFRRVFYAVSPNETSFKSIGEVPNYVNEAIPFFIVMFLAEFVLVRATGKGGRYRLNDSISSLSAGIMSRLPHLFARSVEFSAYCWVWKHYQLFELPWDKSHTWILCFLGVDLGYYWFHRLAHEMNIIWASHQTHHSSEEYNLTTALRQSVFQAYFSWAFYLPMAFCIPPSIFLTHVQFNLIYQYWIHTRIVGSLGPLEYILNTPQHHRVHHGRNPYCIDSNYGGTLIIWDRIFGTFVQEDEEVVYGLVHPVGRWDAFHVQLFHFVYIWEKFWASKWTDKLSVVFKGPGWGPGKPRLGDPSELPEVHAPSPVYDERHSLWADFYLALHFALMMPLFQEMSAQKEALPRETLLVGTAFVLFSLYCYGAILEKSALYAQFEILRCVTAAILLVYYPPTFIPFPAESFQVYFPLFYGLSAISWTAEQFTRSKPKTA